MYQNPQIKKKSKNEKHHITTLIVSNKIELTMNHNRHVTTKARALKGFLNREPHSIFKPLFIFFNMAFYPTFIRECQDLSTTVVILQNLTDIGT